MLFGGSETVPNCPVLPHRRARGGRRRCGIAGVVGPHGGEVVHEDRQRVAGLELPVLGGPGPAQPEIVDGVLDGLQDLERSCRRGCRTPCRRAARPPCGCACTRPTAPGPAWAEAEERPRLVPPHAISSRLGPCCRPPAGGAASATRRPPRDLVDEDPGVGREDVGNLVPLEPGLPQAEPPPAEVARIIGPEILWRNAWACEMNLTSRWRGIAA